MLCQYTGLGPAAEAKFTPTGALWMLGKPQAENVAMVARLAKFGVEAQVMDADAVQAKWPVLDTTPYPEFNPTTGELVEKDHGAFSAVHEVFQRHTMPCLEHERRRTRPPSPAAKRQLFFLCASARCLSPCVLSK